MNSIDYIPPGTQNHGNPNLLCRPPKWTDYLTFFGANYLAHAATLIGRPGSTWLETFVDTANALFIPGSGALRSINFLIRYFTLPRTSSLDPVSQVGGFCMVVKEESLHRASNGCRRTSSAEARHDWFSTAFNITEDMHEIPPGRAIYGTCRLPDRKGYALIEVPPQVKLQVLPELLLSRPGRRRQNRRNRRGPIRTKSSDDFQVPATHDVPRILASTLQILWGIVTIFKTRGNQIELYGYGAFGLTVAPYAIMSFINLGAHLIYPHYSTMYLVYTKDLDDAAKESNDQGRFAGCVAKVKIDYRRGRHPTNLSYHPMSSFTFHIVYGLCYVIIVVTPFIINAAFTGFSYGTNRTIQRGWILAWLIVGSVSAAWVSKCSHKGPWFRLIVCIPLWIPAIGGMVVVRQMLEDFGVCIRL